LCSDDDIGINIMKNSQSAPYILDENYETRLKTSNDKLKIKRVALALPALTPEQESVLANNLSFGCFRVAKLLFRNQGVRTDIINQQCGVANVSDTVKGTEKAQTARLDRIGLTIHCELVPAKNRYGSKSVIGCWWVTISNQQKWFEAEQRISEAA
jgi:hypothetical protein